jgi:prevent-host-death family protein
MMDPAAHTIGAFEAKTHFSDVLNRVEDGETITITRHGRPVAKIVPENQHRRDQALEAAGRLKGLRGTVQGVGIDELLDTVHAGHRY